MGEKGVDTKVVLEGRYGFSHSAYSMGVGREPDKRIKRYLAWYSLWLEGASEERTLLVLKGQGLGEFQSSQHLYEWLADDGFPVCKKCGETPAEPQHCAKAKESTTKKRRKETTAAPIKLPPASAASASFTEALDHLRRAAETLHLEEGRRIIPGQRHRHPTSAQRPLKGRVSGGDRPGGLRPPLPSLPVRSRGSCSGWTLFTEVRVRGFSETRRLKTNLAVMCGTHSGT